MVLAVTRTTFLVAFLGSLCRTVDPLLILLLWSMLGLEVVCQEPEPNVAWLDLILGESCHFHCLDFLGGMLGFDTLQKRIGPKETLTMVTAIV